jgi:hypothetical protein
MTDRIMMMTFPELIIGYGEQGEPVSAACTVCGEWMPEDHSHSLPAAQVIAVFKSHFESHVRDKHPRKTIN